MILTSFSNWVEAEEVALRIDYCKPKLDGAAGGKKKKYFCLKYFLTHLTEWAHVVVVWSVVDVVTSSFLLWTWFIPVSLRFYNMISISDVIRICLEGKRSIYEKPLEANAFVFKWWLDNRELFQLIQFGVKNSFSW